MKKTVLLIFAALFGMLSASAVQAADEGALIRDAILKEGAGMSNIQIIAIKNSGDWALAAFTYEDEKHATIGASALLKKSGQTWQLIQFTGKTPTTDLLKQNQVPSNLWGDLIDGNSVSTTMPVLAFLHSQFPAQSFESIELSGNYALARWYGGEDSGMTLVRKSGNTWKILMTTGGVIDRRAMRHWAVPLQDIKTLMGIQ